MPTYFNPPLYATQFIFYVGLPSQASAHTFQSNPTIASGDFKVSIDGGSLANLSTLPAVTPASSKLVKVTLSASEMTGGNIVVIGSDASGAEWDDVVISIQPAQYQWGTLYSAVTSLSAGAVTASSVTNQRITQYRGTTWSIALTDVGALTGYSKLYFTVKKHESDTDAQALLQIEIAGGLSVLNGATYGTAANGSITVDDAATGDVTITVKPAATKLLQPATNLYFDFKSVISSVVTVEAAGTLTIAADVTRAVS